MLRRITEDYMAEEAADVLEQIVIDADNNRVSATFDRTLYPLDAIYGAAYIFIDRAYVVLDAPGENSVKVELRSRDDADAATLEGLIGEFANELLTQAWRAEITEKNRLTIETVTMHALAGAGGLPKLDSVDLDEMRAGDSDFDEDDAIDLDDLDDDDDLDYADDVFDDPLGIAQPWEEKYAKGGDTAATAEGGEPAAENAASEAKEQS